MGEIGVLGLIVLMMLLLVGTVVVALSRGRTEDPAAVLAERYAKGEISEEEYTRRLSILTYGPPILLPPSLQNDPPKDEGHS
jgi:uncharacterized membrane protein